MGGGKIDVRKSAKGAIQAYPYQNNKAELAKKQAQQLIPDGYNSGPSELSYEH